MTESVAKTAYTLSSVPPLLGPVTLLVGVEEQDDGSVKAYLGARWKGIYLHVHADEAEDFRRAWGSGAPHVWLYPVPPADLLHKDENAASQSSTVLTADPGKNGKPAPSQEVSHARDA
jgi:hypothetical protein